MNFLFAWRYFKAKKSTNAINIISWVSMIAIIVITAAFIVLLSVFNGFEGLVKSLYSTFYADMRIVPASGKVITISPKQLQQLSETDGVVQYTLVVEEKTLLKYDETQTIVFLKGVDSNYHRVTRVPEKMIRGSFNTGDADDPRIVLGSGIENALGLMSDRSVFPVTAYLFRPGVNINVIDPLQAFSVENLSPSGTFFIQQDIDNAYALTSVDFMKMMLNMGPGEYGSVEMALDPAKNPEKVRTALKNIFGPDYLIETRYEQNRSLYNVMTLEKWVIYGILTLMLVVASFTMIGALSMLVLEKQKDIQVLKSLGAGNGLIQKIFLTEGLLLGGIGGAAGMIIAALICWAQVEFKLIGIQGGTFLVDYYPVKMLAGDFILVAATVLLMTLLASWIPARKAALQPIELRTA